MQAYYEINKFKRSIDQRANEDCLFAVDKDHQWYISLEVPMHAIKKGRLTGVYLWKLGYADPVCRAFFSYSKYNDTIKIADILSNCENRGYGSQILKSILQIARHLSVGTVEGDLSSVDKDHFDKLEYFYNKQGFTVTFNHDRTVGGIKFTVLQ